MAFHDVLFPPALARGVRGGPERRTEIVTLASGHEERNGRWRHSRRRWEAGYGVRTLAQLAEVVAFFEARRGRLHGFRFADPVDHSSAPPGAPIAPTDQTLGMGDGTNRRFPLQKRYGGAVEPYFRPIVKPRAAGLRVAVGGVEAIAGVAFDIEAATGHVVFRAGQAPPQNAAVTAGFLFDVPVRFDADRLDVDLSAFEAGAIPDVPLVEILL
jgi:uncharacterized protein (TIGR02217 family)